MFTMKWILENLIAPLVVAFVFDILKQIFKPNFVQIVEHIKKRHFLVDMQGFTQYYLQAA